ncbi:MAG: thermonuclease family protein [Planctomycetaceae bacterium]|nr:thermonuclease family protein [Planctomycetaceae bacterium]
MANSKNDIRGILGILSVLIGWLLFVLPPVISERQREDDRRFQTQTDVSTEQPGRSTNERLTSSEPAPGAQPRNPPAGGETLEAPASSWQGKVVGVSDGDTIDVLTSANRKVRLRLNAVDCPETGQPFGANAKKFVSDRVGGRMVRVVETDRDRYGRSVAEVYDGSDVTLNVALVEAGLAWHYKQYAADRTDIAAAEQRARSQLRGLWGGSHRPVAPWNWRKLSKVERDRYR